jgi:hypothetical protein
MARPDLYGHVPPDLIGADDALHKYGRWAKDRMRLHRCGSAERSYRSPPDEKDREPRAILMHIDQAMNCQRALARVPERERVVLAVLYVPHRMPVELRLKRLRIPPALSRERHILGLRMFDNMLKWVYSRSAKGDTLRAHAITQAQAPAGTACL